MSFSENRYPRPKVRRENVDHIDDNVAKRPNAVARVTAMLAAAVLLTLGSAPGSAAMAEQSPKQAKPVPGRLIEAPVGHRQPRAEDLPPRVRQNEGTITRPELDVDKRIEDICRGC